jgi:hypothetical protein
VHHHESRRNPWVGCQAWVRARPVIAFPEFSAGPGLRSHGGSRRERGPHGRGPSDATRPADVDEVNRLADVVF